MNRNDFLNMIGTRAPVDRYMLGEVYELIDLFPYFQSAHMLLLKGLKGMGDVKFEKQLRSSAVHIADREVLYYFLKTEKPAEEGLDDVSAKQEQVAHPENETQQTVIESSNSELLISEIENDNGQPRPEEQEEKSDLIPSHSVLIQSESEIDDSTGVMLLTDDPGSAEDEKLFYMDPGFSIPEQSDLLELDTDGVDFSASEVTSIRKGEVQNLDLKDSKKLLQTELIDKFIIANPRIEPVKEKSAQPAEDLSKTAVEESGGFVTETLARIYVSQGYYSKAIDIYEKLSLKFPEKSSYFASQIEKVKEYLKK